MDGAIASFAGNLAANLAVGAIRGFVNGVKGIGKAAVDQASKIESLVTQIGTLTGSAESAQAILEDLQQFAATTPFQLEGLAESSKLLLAFGKTQEEIIPTLQILGDVAAGTGTDLRELTRIFGQVQAAGKLTGERLLQFQERAIPIGPAIAKTLGVAEDAVKDLVSAGKVTTEVFEEAFGLLNKEGGAFADGMIRQSKTLSGVLSTLNDNIDLVLNDIGQELLPIIKEFATGLIDLIQKNKEFIKTLAQSVISDFAAAIGLAAKGIEALTSALDNNKSSLEFFDKTIEKLVPGVKLVRQGLFLMRIALEREKDEARLAAIATDLASGSYQTLATKAKDAADVVGQLNKALMGGGEAFQSIEPPTVEGGQSVETDEGREARAKRLEEEQKFIDDLAAIREEGRILEDEIKLATDEEDKEALIALREASLQEEAEFIKKRGELTNSLDLSVQAQKLKNQTAFDKKVVANAAKTAKEKAAVEKGLADATLKLEQDTAKARLNLAAAVGSQLISGLVKNSKAQFFLQKAVSTGIAIVAAFQASNLALATPPGPPITAPLAAATLTAGLTNAGAIAATAISGFFAGGGVVPGNSTSGDRVLARVNSGELILNQEQQANLFDTIDQGSLGGGGTTINVEGNIIADSDEQIDNLIFRINDSIEFRNVPLETSREVLA